MYDPDDVPERLSKPELYQAIHAIMNQYDMEDFDLGIKQFMIEQAIQQEMEDGLNKSGEGDGGARQRLWVGGLGWGASPHLRRRS